MSKWKWIAQDSDGQVSKYKKEPQYDYSFWGANGSDYKFIGNKEENPNWKETKINLETEDYEIVDGILKRLPRKTKLDELIARVKLIDKKAAKWINKNRHLCNDINNFNALFCLETPQGYDYWIDIRDRLDSAPTPPKQTVRYRVSLHSDKNGHYPKIASNAEDEMALSAYVGFKEWLTDWIEVEV